MYKKGAGNDKQGKDEGNRTLCPYRNFSQAINKSIPPKANMSYKIPIPQRRSSKLKSKSSYKKFRKWTITLKMADQGRPDFYVVFTMSLCALGLKQLLISLLFQIIPL